MELPFSSFICAEYISDMSPDIIPEEFRREQQRLGVPSLNAYGCRLLCMLASVSKPETAIDIGCGIGVSTVAIHKGAPHAVITALDANRERAETCRQLTSGMNVNVYTGMAEDYLANTDEKYNFAFIDSIKKDYAGIWYLLKKKLAHGAVAVFDDILLHGYVGEDDAVIPWKYREGTAELREFLKEISTEYPKSQIIPLGGGMLIISL